MPQTARIGDPFAAGDAVAQGSPNVLVNNIPVARQGDATTGHGCFPPSTIIEGAGSVLVNNIPVAYVGHKNVVHCCGPSCHDEAIISGSGDVITE